MPREITEQERLVVQESLQRARAAMCAIADYDQAHVDKLCQAVAWAAGNEVAAGKLGKMSVEESGMGDPAPGRRLKILGILRDALRQKSMGVIEEDPVKGIVKYAKPAGVIASLDSGDEPLRHAGRHRHLRHQVQGRRHLLAASGQQKDHHRDRAHDARSAQPARRARRHLAMRRKAEHPARAGADVDLRSDHRHRRPGDGHARRTAPANLPTASAPATRPWSSTKPPTSKTPPEIPASARPTTTDRAAQPTATWWSTSSIYDQFLAAIAAAKADIWSMKKRRSSCVAPTGTPRAIGRRRPSPTGAAWSPSWPGSPFRPIRHF